MKEKNQKANWKDYLSEGLVELLVAFAAMGIGLFVVWLLPFDLPDDLDFELVILIGIIILLPFIILIGYIVYFIRNGYKMKEFRFIRKSLKEKYKLILITTTQYQDGKEVEMPLLIGKNKNGKFKLIQEKDKLTFSTDYNLDSKLDNRIEYPKDILSAIQCIEKFMEEK